MPQCAKNVVLVILYNYSLQLLLRRSCDYNFILETRLSSKPFSFTVQGWRWNHSCWDRRQDIEIWLNTCEWSVGCCKLYFLLLRHWSKINRTTAGLNGAFVDSYRIAEGYWEKNEESKESWARSEVTHSRCGRWVLQRLPSGFPKLQGPHSRKGVSPGDTYCQSIAQISVINTRL